MDFLSAFLRFPAQVRREVLLRSGEFRQRLLHQAAEQIAGQAVGRPFQGFRPESGHFLDIVPDVGIIFPLVEVFQFSTVGKIHLPGHFPAPGTQFRIFPVHGFYILQHLVQPFDSAPETGRGVRERGQDIGRRGQAVPVDLPEQSAFEPSPVLRGGPVDPGDLSVRHIQIEVVVFFAENDVFPVLFVKQPETVLRPSLAVFAVDEVQLLQFLQAVSHANPALEAVGKDAEVRGLRLETVPFVNRFFLRMLRIPGQVIEEPGVRVIESQPVVDHGRVDLVRLAQQADDLVGRVFPQRGVERLVPDALGLRRKDDGEDAQEKEYPFHMGLASRFRTP